MRPSIITSCLENVIFGRYTWEAAVKVRRCDVDHYAECDQLRRPRSSPDTILEDARDIWTRDVQMIMVERKGILNQMNRFERQGVSASHEPQ
jgi:hypothetical protein